MITVSKESEGVKSSINEQTFFTLTSRGIASSSDGAPSTTVSSSKSSASWRVICPSAEPSSSPRGPRRYGRRVRYRNPMSSRSKSSWSARYQLAPDVTRSRSSVPRPAVLLTGTVTRSLRATDALHDDGGDLSSCDHRLGPASGPEDEDVRHEHRTRPDQRAHVRLHQGQDQEESGGRGETEAKSEITAHEQPYR